MKLSVVTINRNNAMNKGVRMVTGDYIQILNSVDSLATDNVTERMLAELERYKYMIKRK